MDIVLAVLTSSPYRESVATFADDFASSLQGSVRVLTPAQLSAPATGSASVMDAQDQEQLLNRAEAQAEHDIGTSDSSTVVDGEWLVGPAVRECIREMAQCDFGVVGKTLHGALPEGQALGRQVLALKKSCTRPLIIVPQAVRPLRKVLFVYTNHPEAGHALSLARPLSEAGKDISLFVAAPVLGPVELEGSGQAYLEEHRISHKAVKYDCSQCDLEGGGAGPVGDILHLVKQEEIDLVVMGGTRRGFLGRMLWPEMAHEVAWNIQVPLLIWY